MHLCTAATPRCCPVPRPCPPPAHPPPAAGLRAPHGGQCSARARARQEHARSRRSKAPSRSATPSTVACSTSMPPACGPRPTTAKRAPPRQCVARSPRMNGAQSTPPAPGREVSCCNSAVSRMASAFAGIKHPTPSTHQPPPHPRCPATLPSAAPTATPSRHLSALRPPQHAARPSGSKTFRLAHAERREARGERRLDAPACRTGTAAACSTTRTAALVPTANATRLRST